MSIFEHPAFDGHEHVVFAHDPETGLRAVLAVHDTTLGPALGGLRMWPYASEAEAVTDVLRLARGMTYKNALAGLAHGGGKAVIIGDPRRDKSPQLMQSMGRVVNRLNGLYITAEDSGMTVADMAEIARTTRYVTGVAQLWDADGVAHSGDPSPATALGVYTGIQVAVRQALGRDELDGLQVAIQGLGSVGYRLARHLYDAGAELIVADVDPERVERARREFGARAADPATIHAESADVFAPCALGAVINDATAAAIRARIVAGAANNQLAGPRHGEVLHERGILYAPDYVINAGGVIDVGAQWAGYDPVDVRRRVLAIGGTLNQVLQRAKSGGERPEVVADRMALERLRGAA